MLTLYDKTNEHRDFQNVVKCDEKKSFIFITLAVLQKIPIQVDIRVQI